MSDAIGRRGSTATGKLVIGPPEVLHETSFVPIPPPPPVKVPVITVTEFDGLITANGWDMEWNDGNGNHTHIFTKNGGLYVSVTNSAGEGHTGVYRKVI